MPSLLHDALVKKAGSWLRSIGCSIVFEEMVTAAGETPDAIGWSGSHSVLVECKASRRDFIKDKQKCWRRLDVRDGLGEWRFYLCPRGMIQPEEVAESKWGLLWCHGKKKKIEVVVGPEMHKQYAWGCPPFKSSKRSEILMMVSALRRSGITKKPAKQGKEKTL